MRSGWQLIGAAAFFLGGALAAWAWLGRANPAVPRLTGEQIIAVANQQPIAPADFVFAPCEGVQASAECVVIAAGGKRVLIGAPAGIGRGVAQGDRVAPDAVLLFSIYADQIEGLDEVRNRAGEAASAGPLRVGGPEGVESVIQGLRQAYIIPDALAYVSGTEAASFDAPRLQANRLRRSDTAFDTGDLQIIALSGGVDHLAYLITYSDIDVILAGCGARPEDQAGWPQADAYIGCEEKAVPDNRLGTWPLQERVYIGLL